MSESTEEDLEGEDDPTHDPTQQNHAQNGGFEEDEEDVQEKGGLDKGRSKEGLEDRDDRDTSSTSNNIHNPTHTKETEREDKSEDGLASSSTYSIEPDFKALSTELEKRYKPKGVKA